MPCCSMLQCLCCSVFLCVAVFSSMRMPVTICWIEIVEAPATILLICRVSEVTLIELVRWLCPHSSAVSEWKTKTRKSDISSVCNDSGDESSDAYCVASCCRQRVAVSCSVLQCVTSVCVSPQNDFESSEAWPLSDDRVDPSSNGPVIVRHLCLSRLS